MKIHLFLLMPVLVCLFTGPNTRTYVASTPAHAEVRDFLGISLTDSIDFIRWKLDLGPDSFELQCKYGVAKPGTPGFINEKKASFRGRLTKISNRYSLQHQGKQLSLLEVNTDLLHLLDQHNDMLIGNSGYSYALNSTAPVKTDQFNIQPVRSTFRYPLDFEGRTPCQELSRLLALNKSEAYDKMKWHIIFYTDSLTGQPSYYLKGGIGYRKETMEKGKWQFIKKEDGRIFYQLHPDNNSYSLYLLKGDDNILFFTDPEGRLLVGNEDFSYTLNRRKEEHPPIYR